VELGKLRLKRGTSLIISPWQLQRDERHWTDPDSFRLDRSYNTPAFMPFGLGPRACVGIGLGLLELQLLALKSPPPALWTSCLACRPPRQRRR